MKHKTLTYLIFLLIPLAIGGLGGLITSGGMPAFQHLSKPSFTPPPILFPIVWTLLYLLMGVGGARVWLSGSPRRRLGILLFGVQLVLNLFWTVWFFGARLYFLAFLWLLILIVVISWMIQVFREIDKTAGNLQFPYLAWCCFAAVLNFFIFLMN